MGGFVGFRAPVTPSNIANVPAPNVSGVEGCCNECYSNSIGTSNLFQNPVNVPIVPIQLCNANSSRKELILVNTSTDFVYVSLGQPPQPGNSPSPFAYSFVLAPCQAADDGSGGVWISDIWQGTIFLSSFSGAGVVNFTEMV